MKYNARRHLDEIELWQWQREAIDAWHASGCRGIVQAVTGAGKTRVAHVAISEVILITGRVLILVPSSELMRQWFVQLREQLPNARIAKMGTNQKPTQDADIIVAIVNSAASRSDWFREWVGFKPALLVADECHRYAAPTFANALQETFDLRLGLTATLKRMDQGEEKYLVPYFERVVYNLDYERALADKVIAPWKVVQVGVTLREPERNKYLRLQQRRSVAADLLASMWRMDQSDPEFFVRVATSARSSSSRDERENSQEYMAAFAEQRRVTSETSQKFDAFGKLIQRLEPGRSALVFTSTKAAAELAADKAKAASLIASVVHSDIPHSARAAALEDFSEGDVQMLFAPRVLDEGVDVPDCGVAFILGMGSNPRQLKQRLGRIIRTAPGKQAAVLYYVYAMDTHEDVEREITQNQWEEVLANAIAVESLTIDEIRIPSQTRPSG